jgi:hypothetical protein
MCLHVSLLILMCWVKDIIRHWLRLGGKKVWRIGGREEMGHRQLWWAFSRGSVGGNGMGCDENEDRPDRREYTCMWMTSLMVMSRMIGWLYRHGISSHKCNNFYWSIFKNQHELFKACASIFYLANLWPIYIIAYLNQILGPSIHLFTSFPA